MYLHRDDDHQDCPPKGCSECSKEWIPQSEKLKIDPLKDIDWKNREGAILFRLTRGMGCVRLTEDAARRLGKDRVIVNLRVLDHLVAI